MPRAVLLLTSTRRIPARPSLASMPTEVLDTILSFLPSDDLGRVQRTCHRLRAAAREPRLWTAHLLADFHVVVCAQHTNCRPVDGRAPSRHQRLYGQHFAFRAARVRSQRAAQQRRALEESAERRSRLVNTCFDIIEFPLGLGVPCVCVVVFLILVMLKAGGVIDIAYSQAWSPWWAAVSLATVTTVPSLAVRRWVQRAPLTSMWRCQSFSTHTIAWMLDSLIGDSMDFYLPEWLRVAGLATLGALAFVAQPLLLQLNANNHAALASSPAVVILAPMLGVHLSAVVIRYFVKLNGCLLLVYIGLVGWMELSVAIFVASAGSPTSIFYIWQYCVACMHVILAIYYGRGFDRCRPAAVRAGEAHSEGWWQHAACALLAQACIILAYAAMITGCVERDDVSLRAWSLSPFVVGAICGAVWLCVWASWDSRRETQR